MPEDLAGEQAFGVLAAQARGDGDRRVDVRQAEQGGGAGTLQRLQAQYRTGDDAEGAFGADEQLLEVVAGGVLQQPAQVAVDAAVGEYRFQAEHALAHGAEAEGADAAGVGRDQPADAGAAARGEIDAGVESGLGGQRLGLFEGDAGVEVEGLAGRIQPMYAVQPAQRGSTSPACAAPPPTRPVSPPWGTRARPIWRHRRTTAATWSVLSGRTRKLPARFCGW